MSQNVSARTDSQEQVVSDGERTAEDRTVDEPKSEVMHPLSADWKGDSIVTREQSDIRSTPTEGDAAIHAETSLSGTSFSPLVWPLHSDEARQAGSARDTHPEALPAVQTTNGVVEVVGGENEALSVRTNMLRNYWQGFSSLTKFRRWILILRLLIALAQAVAGIVVLALPTSLGDSFSTPETCDPEGMFVFLVLHVTRVVCSVPVDLYLGLSPHRSPRARRRGAEGLVERERNRRVGSLRLDRKMGRLSDLLGFCHIVLFIVGNYVVWTSVECSHSPADSQPLFFTCVAMLSITYLIIVEVALMVFLVIFFLPLLIAILSALGLSHRLPQRDIHPETGKIGQDDIEKYSSLVYYTPLSGEVEDNTATQSPNTEEQTAGQGKSDVRSDLPSAPIRIEGSDNADVPSTQRKTRIGRLFGLTRQQSGPSSTQRIQQLDGQKGRDAGKESDVRDDDVAAGKIKYPLHPMPAHRATCPICLSDYEDAKEVLRRLQGSTPATTEGEAPNPSQEASHASTASQSEGASSLEPLRLLRCGHVMHKACVDQWLTAVSGRCPVCQRPIIESDKEAGDVVQAQEGRQQ